MQSTRKISNKLQFRLVPFQAISLVNFQPTSFLMTDTKATQTTHQKDEIKKDTDIVTPWDVVSEDATGIDYDKLIKKFGSEPITDQLKERMEKITGQKLHRFLRRGMFFSHRELGNILNLY